RTEAWRGSGAGRGAAPFERSRKTAGRGNRGRIAALCAGGIVPGNDRQGELGVERCGGRRSDVGRDRKLVADGGRGARGSRTPALRIPASPRVRPSAARRGGGSARLFTAHRSKARLRFGRPGDAQGGHRGRAWQVGESPGRNGGAAPSPRARGGRRPRKRKQV